MGMIGREVKDRCVSPLLSKSQLSRRDHVTAASVLSKMLLEILVVRLFACAYNLLCGKRPEPTPSMRNAAAILRLTRSSSLPLAIPPLARHALAVPRPPCTFSRGFASSSLLLKKAKPSLSSKPAKGKARAAESSDEPTVDLADVLEKTKGKMVKAVEWAKGVLYDGVERGRGRVSPGEPHLSSHIPNYFKGALPWLTRALQPCWMESRSRYQIRPG